MGTIEPALSHPFDEIAIIGCGAIGLPLGVALASRGQRVVGIDIDASRVATLRRGVVEAREQELDAALVAALSAGTLRFETALLPSWKPRAYVIAVPTPADDEGRLDEAALDDAVRRIADVAREHDLIMIRSTVPIGTARTIAARLDAAGKKVLVAATPDRSLSGRSFADQFRVPHVIGGGSSRAAQQATAVLQLLGQVVDAETAETAEAIKLFANVQRDVWFALANELAMICEALDLDFHRIRRLGSHDYERFSVARAGPVGGPCLTKDIHLLAASLSPGQQPPRLGLVGRRVNGAVLDHVVRIAEAVVDRAADPPAVAVLGLAFKGLPVTTEQRGSFGLSFIEQMQSRRPRVTVRGWDPEATVGAPRLEEVVRDCSVVVLATEHRVLREIDLGSTGRLMARPGLIIDLWGDNRPKGVTPEGVAYHAFGARRPPLPE